MNKKLRVFFIIFGIIICAGAAGFWLAQSHKTISNFQFPISLNTSALATTANDVFYDSSSTTHRSASMDQSFFDDFYNSAPPVEPTKDMVISAIIPHHLAAGKYLASFFNQLSNQKPEVVVLFGPNHPQAGRNNFVTSLYDWRTAYGTLKVNREVVEKLSGATETSPTALSSMEERGIVATSPPQRRGQGEVSLVAVDEKIIDTEHTIGADVSFIKKTWPNTTLVPIIIKNKATPAEIEQLAKKLKEILPEKSLVLASVDFSHYLPEYVSDFHDELSENVLATGDLNRVPKLEIDSQPSIQLMLEYNKLKNTQNFHEVFHTNSASIANHPEWLETTSHVLGYYTSSKYPIPNIQYPIISLQFFGDIMLDRNVSKAMGTEGLDYIFKNIRGQENRFFQGMDLLVANLEGPFAPARIKTSKSIAFRFDPRWATQLKKYNFTAFDLGNNHTYDMGIANVAYTRNLLQKNNLHYFGDQLKEGPQYTWYFEMASDTSPTALSSVEERGIVATSPRRPSGRGQGEVVALGEGQGEVSPVSQSAKIAFIGIESVTHKPDLKAIKSAIDDAKKQADYVIVNAHSGTEYKRLSTQSQRDLYHWLIDNGATAVIGHHPHVVEEMEIYKGAPIFYSFGNFIFDQYFSKDTQEGLSVGLTLQNGHVKNIYLFPFYGVKSQVQLMTGTRRDEFLKWMGENSRLDGREIENGKIDI